ncbi:L-lactate permease [Anaeromyxobacter sp. Fw109-5]|uniref:L-lactate permease n=1 Tax=Anaeromyxobacter sp. (strain Fw109-5) TaxID=404589 RepID=UPI0000ED7CE7|nr:L-lactate permease [Anaeromyxobacter sp. Fw109-5]ABS25645.1 L-lactate transport [Anaeromyxobacter sp. Fw109-5]
MSPWIQGYTPLGNLFLSALVAALPVVVLLGALAFFHVKAHVAAVLGLVLALAIAIFVYGMPAQMAGATALYGAAFGLLPIGWIVLNAIFVYDITVKTGKFEVVKDTIAGLAGDRRIQVLLIAFAFGAFIEGAAGFGTPVAISAAMLIGLGFKPLAAAGLALIGNTAPVAYGALGTPIITLAKVTGLPELSLSAMAGRQLPLFSLIVPFWLVWAMAGFRGMLGVWPACLVAGLSFAIPQFVVSNFFGPSLVDIVAAASCIVSTYLFLKVWQPKEEWRFADERAAAPAGVRPSLGAAGTAPHRKHSPRDAFMGWMPWIVLSVLVFIWGMPSVKTWLNGIFNPTWDVPFLHNLVLKAPPVAKALHPEAAKFSLNLLSATGTSLLLAGVVAGLWLKLGVRELVKTYLHTLKRVRFSLLTIAAMLALGFTTRYSGSDSTMGLAFASTGWMFPFFSPLLGWLGVALTGSDTSSNVLFGNLQVVSAQQIGMSPILAAASNSTGGVMGKMIDAQSIVVASVATNQHGQEGVILRYVFWHSLVLACLVGVVTFLQAYWLTGMVPK